MKKKYKIDIAWERCGTPYFAAFERRLWYWVRVPNMDSFPDISVIEQRLKERLALPIPIYCDANGDRISPGRSAGKD